MTPTHHRVLPVRQGVDVGHARRVVSELGRSIALDEEHAGKAAIVATELGTNLVKHAEDGGEILVRPMTDGTHGGLELISVDRGPGIADPGRALQDGYTTGTSPGTGLGAVRRLSRLFELHTQRGKGTVIVSRIGPAAAADAAADGFEVGAVMVPYPELDVCGDGWDASGRDGALQLMVVDGLGHGDPASEAARAALRAHLAHAHAELPELMQFEHEALRDTRGAVLAVARIEREPRALHYVGFGDISARVLGAGGSQTCVSRAGIVGARIPRPHVYTYAWDPPCLLVMHSDGLRSRWDLAPYPGLEARHPTVIAAVLYRDHSRGNDDVTVVVVRERPGSER